MRTRFRFVTIFLICSISIWLMIILYNIAKVDDTVDRWPPRVPSVAEPLVGLTRQQQQHKSSIESFGLQSQQIDDWQSNQNHNVESMDKRSKIRNVDDEKRPSDKVTKTIRFPFNQMNQIDVIFYQLDMKTKDRHISSTTSNTEHEIAAHEACFIRNEVDNYVQNQGDRLFAFNLLASNRIGFYRSLPDTRHKLCKINKQTGGKPIIINQTSHNEVLDSKQQYVPNDETTSTFPKKYPVNIKPKASVIICYFNEAPSALLRTLYTVIKRSPNEMLLEIIVVDDFSDNDFHSNKIKPFIEEFGLVSLHRTEKREGLIRARLFGAKLAKGEVLIFLDSHVEANVGWLEPLMEQIDLDRTTVACPMIDLINPETMIYTSSPMVVGATSWSLHFKWISVASEKLTTQEDFIKPLESPTMAGGLYAIDKEFFYHLGEYDSGMELWGGENVEISFRIWLCGGRVVVLSCSRVGHIFRKRRPYGPAPDKPDCLLYNSHRAARVWLGDHIEQFYNAEPGALKLDSGDVTDRLALKDKLKCKSFDWYIQKVYPQMIENLNKKSDDKPDSKIKPKLFMSNRKRFDRGIHRTTANSKHELNETKLSQFNQTKLHHINQTRTITKKFKIQADKSDLCVQAKESPFTKGFFRLLLGNCNDTMINDTAKTSLTDYRSWIKTEQNEFRLSGDQCLDLIKNLPLLRRCHNLGYFQTWETGNGSQAIEIYNIKAGLCLAVERARFGEPIIVTLCDKTIHNSQHEKLEDKSKLSRHSTWNRSEPFWNTGPDLFPQVARLRFLAHDSGMPIIQKWNFIYEM